MTTFLECTVKIENNKDTIIRFCVWENKIAYKVTEDLKINDEIELKKIHKKYGLNDSIINSYLSKLIKPENTSKPEVKENPQTINKKKPANPSPANAKSPKEKKGAETKSADILD